MPTFEMRTPHTHMQAADLVLWVGISFEQSASVEYFRRVRSFLAAQGRLEQVQQVGALMGVLCISELHDSNAGYWALLAVPSRLWVHPSLLFSFQLWHGMQVESLVMKGGQVFF